MESKTLIIATMGPSTTNAKIISELIKHRMDVARLNFSWDTHESHKDMIKKLRDTSNSLNRKISIMQDLSGPRIQDGVGHHFGGEIDHQVVTEKDTNDLKFGIEQGVDMIAMSFVGHANDIIHLRNLVKENGGNQKIIAKIERKVAFENIDEILEVADGVMVARGDLGNEYPLEEIPIVQHKIIKKANTKGKMVIVATEMMLSMVDSPTPTRAEVSDITYAVLDGANGVMLSEESAKGEYPVEAVTMMEKILLTIEKHKGGITIN